MIMQSESLFGILYYYICLTPLQSRLVSQVVYPSIHIQLYVPILLYGLFCIGHQRTLLADSMAPSTDYKGHRHGRHWTETYRHRGSGTA